MVDLCFLRDYEAGIMMDDERLFSLLSAGLALQHARLHMQEFRYDVTMHMHIMARQTRVGINQEQKVNSNI